MPRGERFALSEAPGVWQLLASSCNTTLSYSRPSLDTHPAPCWKHFIWLIDAGIKVRPGMQATKEAEHREKVDELRSCIAASRHQLQAAEDGRAAAKVGIHFSVINTFAALCWVCVQGGHEIRSC